METQDKNTTEQVQLDKTYCKQLIQQIINKFHTHPDKKKIQEQHDGLAFADPITGDSKKNPRMKRCHLYWDSMFIISYDDDGYKMPFTSFCKKLEQDIDPDQRMAIYTHLENNITTADVEDDFISNKFDQMVKLDDMMDVFNNAKSNSPITNFKPIEPKGWAEYYLTKRGIPEYLHKNIYQAEYIKGADWSERVIVLLNRKGQYVLGCQVRNLKDGYQRMFKVYNFEQLNKWVYPDREIDDMKMIMYNKLSYYFNVLNIDFNRVITIFEGYLDSLFFPNAIGVVGLGTDLKFFERNQVDIRYVFDNDDPGHKKSAEKIGNYPVFLWSKLFEDIVNKKNTKDPYSLSHRISKVKDMNKIAQMVPNPYKELDLINYFSQDIYDKHYIPKVEAKKQYKKYKKNNGNQYGN